MLLMAGSVRVILDARCQSQEPLPNGGIQWEDISSRKEKMAGESVGELEDGVTYPGINKDRGQCMVTYTGNGLRSVVLRCWSTYDEIDIKTRKWDGCINSLLLTWKETTCNPANNECNIKPYVYISTVHDPNRK